MEDSRTSGEGSRLLVVNFCCDGLEGSNRLNRPRIPFLLRAFLGERSDDSCSITSSSEFCNELSLDDRLEPKRLFHEDVDMSGTAPMGMTAKRVTMNANGSWRRAKIAACYATGSLIQSIQVYVFKYLNNFNYYKSATKQSFLRRHLDHAVYDYEDLYKVDVTLASFRLAIKKDVARILCRRDHVTISTE